MPIQCELCHTPLKYKVSRRRDLDCNEFKTNFDKDRCNFIVFFLLEAGLFAVFLALVVLLGLSNSGSTLGDKIRDLIVRN